MTEEQFELLRSLNAKLDKLLENQSAVNVDTTLQAIHRSILKLAYVHQDAFTLKQVSDRTNIPVKTLHRYVKEGKLKAIEEYGMKTIVRHEEILNFLMTLQGKG